MKDGSNLSGKAYQIYSEQLAIRWAEHNREMLVIKSLIILAILSVNLNVEGSQIVSQKLRTGNKGGQYDEPMGKTIPRTSQSRAQYVEQHSCFGIGGILRMDVDQI